jgi:predicted nucleic acid-binding protein
VYLDTCYIAKFHLNEPESSRVRELVRKANTLYSSVWAMAEYHAVLHRHSRESGTTASDSHNLSLRFFEHLEDGLWNLVPVNEGLLRRTSSLIVSAPPGLYYDPSDIVSAIKLSA